MEPRRGAYVGTERDGRWWKRALGDGLFVRGLGSYAIDDLGFVFRRIGVQREIVIPFAKMRAVRIGRWHAGRWGARQPIIKIDWEQDGRDLSSGFVIPDRAEANQLRDELGRRMIAG